MEETVWIYVGIMAGIIGIGVVVSLFTHQRPQQQQEMLGSTVQSYKELCNQVCKLPVDTKLSVKATIPADALIYTTAEAACAKLGAKLFCGRCDCSFVMNASVLNLTGDDAGFYFKEHEYTCSFKKEAAAVRMECAG